MAIDWKIVLQAAIGGGGAIALGAFFIWICKQTFDAIKNPDNRERVKLFGVKVLNHPFKIFFALGFFTAATAFFGLLFERDFSAKVVWDIIWLIEGFIMMMVYAPFAWFAKGVLDLYSKHTDTTHRLVEMTGDIVDQISGSQESQSLYKQPPRENKSE